MFKFKKIWKCFALVPVVGATVWSTTACGTSTQYLHPQFLVKFNKALDQDGYLPADSSAVNSSDEHYYRIDKQVANTKYTETDRDGKPVSVKDVHAANGLVAIYATIAQSIASTAIVLVKYAHENIASPQLLGISFKDKAKDGQVASLKGNFLFASAAAFASGNRSDNVSFGLATLRFDLTAWSPPNNPKSSSGSDPLPWTKALTKVSLNEDDQKRLEKATDKHAFLKLFKIYNIRILYKFYQFGPKVPFPFYDGKSSCLSINKSSPPEQLKKFEKIVAEPFDHNYCSSKHKYRAISFKPNCTDYADGFVLSMQPWVVALSYGFSNDKTPKKVNDGDKKATLIMRPQLPSFILPEAMWNCSRSKTTWTDWEKLYKKLTPTSLTLTSEDGKLLPDDKLKEKLDQNFLVSGEKSKSSTTDDQRFIEIITKIVRDNKDFATGISDHHPQPSEKIKLEKDSDFAGMNFADCFKFFFMTKPNEPIITVVTNSSPNNHAGEKGYQYFGTKIGQQ